MGKVKHGSSINYGKLLPSCKKRRTKTFALCWCHKTPSINDCCLHLQKKGCCLHLPNKKDYCLHLFWGASCVWGWGFLSLPLLISTLQPSIWYTFWPSPKRIKYLNSTICCIFRFIIFQQKINIIFTCEILHFVHYTRVKIHQGCSCNILRNIMICTNVHNTKSQLH